MRQAIKSFESSRLLVVVEVVVVVVVGVVVVVMHVVGLFAAFALA